MTAAPDTDGSITVAFTQHDGDGQVDAAVEDLTDAVDNPAHEIETTAALEIDALLDDPVPSDWNDPVARAARRERLIDVACQAAAMVVELLVHHRLAATHGVKLTAGDVPVVAAARAIEALHRGLVRYRHDTLCMDGWVVATDGMEDTAGAGVASLVVTLIERLRGELTEVMLASR